MISALLGIGLLVSAFAGINTGGSSIGESFGPSVGSGVLSPRKAATLMSIFVVLGGFLVGRHVVDTLGHGFVPSQYFTLPAAIGVLLFTGFGILLGNLREVSVSTSETAVGAVAGMGAAFGVLNWHTVSSVVTWWLISPVVAFWVAAVIGRYFYRQIEEQLNLEGEGGRSVIGKVLVIGIACYMGFSAGASNVANAIAPLVGAGVLEMTPGIILGAGTMAVGAFLIGPRTMETIGNELTVLSLEGALIVEIIAATIITLLSWVGIPASLAITAITCVIGLGWGRASRHVEISRHLRVTNQTQSDGGGSSKYEHPGDLFSEEMTRHVVATWFLSPLVASVLSFVCFKVAVMTGLISF
ncbi:anion permease [Haladaptatus sp. CMAA 1911]|uniref:inorganic phosphate transporter n=1 Tax=unclassified Haladaptatus TaxID=2622732 RepID=UPI0037547D74